MNRTETMEMLVELMVGRAEGKADNLVEEVQEWLETTVANREKYDGTLRDLPGGSRKCSSFTFKQYVT